MKKGFTLVELAIVLVIVGLLVGGTLAGQELIKQAQASKAVAEINNIERALYAFYTKYNGYPGDLRNPTMFFPACNDVMMGGYQTNIVGDGNGKIDSHTMGTVYEYTCTFMQLAVSGLYITKGIEKDSQLPGVPTHDVVFENGDVSALAYWLNTKKYISIRDYMHQMGAFDFEEHSISPGKGAMLMLLGNSSFTTTFSTPEYSYILDSKIDDGHPAKGKMFAQSNDFICYTNSGLTSMPTFPNAESAYDLTVTEEVCALFYKF